MVTNWNRSLLESMDNSRYNHLNAFFWTLLNKETPKQRSNETTFFLEHRNSQRNKFSWYWFCWEICGICKEGLQTWMSRCAIDFANLWKTNRMRILLYPAFHPVYRAKIVRKGGNGTILTNFPNSVFGGLLTSERYCKVTRAQP